MKVQNRQEIPYSVVLLMGSERSVAPESLNGELWAANGDCVAIGTRSEIDGETTLIISNEPVPDGLFAIYEGNISKIENSLSFYDINLNRICESKISGDSVDVKVYVDDLSEPEVIWVSI